MDYQSMRSQIKLPGGLQEPFEKVVAAGMTLLFGEKGNPLLNRSLSKGDVPMGDKIGKSVAAVISIVVGKIKQLPSAVVLPAAVELVLQVSEYVDRSGEEVSETDLQRAVATAVSIVVEHVSNKGKKKELPPIGGQQQPQPQPQPQQAPAGGLLAGA